MTQHVGGAGVVRQSNNFVWDAGSMSWVAETQPSGGGGGGASTIADGADVAEGATTDAAIITDTTGTLSGKLRGLVKWAFERMPASLGQKAMTASLPVVLASDQSAVSVTGPLTDTQLRASAVPVSAASLPLPSGAATAALQTQPGVDIGDVTINNAAGASAVNIQDGGNSITIDASALPLPTGAATETTLGTRLADATFTTRINTQGQKAMAASTPVVIASDQPGIFFNDLAPSSPTAASVGVASAQAVAANASRKGLKLVNTSNARISLGFGAAAVLDSGITLYPGGAFNMDAWDFDLGAVNAIASAAASNLGVQEYA